MPFVIELQGKGTHVRFSSLFEVTTDPIPLDALLKTSDGKPLNPSYIRPYVPCVIQDTLEAAVLAGLADDDSAFEEIGAKTSADYVAALSALEEGMTEKQRAMLIGHAMAPEHELSMQALAEIGGYSKFQSANVQYGILGRKFAAFFDVDGLANQTQAMAWSDGELNEVGHFTWVLRDALVEALYVLGWAPRPSPPDFGTVVATHEIDADAQCSGVPETVRQALIAARVGQGAYRKRLVEIWTGRCALTGCAVPEVLIASHAKSWADSSNEERLDEFNGLLLAAHVDKLFDAGLISFADDGAMLISAALDTTALTILGLAPESRLRFVLEQHRPYLQTHRDRHGFG